MERKPSHCRLSLPPSLKIWKIQLPGDSRWPFHPPVGGRKKPLKRVTWIHHPPRPRPRIESPGGPASSRNSSNQLPFFPLLGNLSLFCCRFLGPSVSLIILENGRNGEKKHINHTTSPCWSRRQCGIHCFFFGFKKKPTKKWCFF